jgi:tRNA pseudouridine38-40 synthase
VQDALERALSEIAGEKISTICAGRTDAGVHALAQVVHFDCTAERPDSAWVRGTNTLLPAQAAVNWMRPVPDEFSARYSALERCYRYVLLNHPVRPALGHSRVGWFHVPLDVARMREAATYLLGEHDFSAFRSSECQARSPIRDLRRLEVRASGEYIVFEFAGNAFLHHMVRNIVGSLVYVGKGNLEPAWMSELLASRDRTKAAPTFDAAGLYLAAVRYDAKWKLPARERSAWFDGN